MTLRWLWEAEAAYFRWFYRTRSRIRSRRAGLAPDLGSTRVVYRKPSAPSPAVGGPKEDG